MDAFNFCMHKPYCNVLILSDGKKSYYIIYPNYTIPLTLTKLYLPQYDFQTII